MQNSQETLALNTAQAKLLNDLLVTLSNEQKLWLGGYLTGLNESTKNVLNVLNSLSPGGQIATDLQVESQNQLTILFGTRSGNAQKVAKTAQSVAQQAGISCKTVSLNEYNPKSIKKEKHLLLAVSTDGEGEPPVAAEEFYNYIMGKKAPKLEGLHYSVLALGDKSYQHFCKIGKDLDSRLQELGAKPFNTRVDCDIDFEDDATKWAQECIETYKKTAPEAKSSGTIPIVEAKPESSYTRATPYKTQILDRIRLNGKGSGKSTYHIELDIEDSGIVYTPGDAIGVVCRNDEKQVETLLKTSNLKADELVNINGSEKSLHDALIEDYEISILAPPVVESYAELSKNGELKKIIEDKSKLSEYVYGRDIIDLIEEFPSKLDAGQLSGVLRKLQPRLYSIASSYNNNPDEVHLTVGAVQYKHGKRNKFGVCSNYLANISDDLPVSIYVDENISFRLPQDSSTPIIMVGAGTGIAPYRAFMQERSLNAANGKSWLLFGDRNFTTDFLYQIEWQKYLKNKQLTRMDVAFSRDQREKIYVQHKLLDNKKEIFKWIEEGANIYVCGDKNAMANDVKNAFRDIVKSQAGFSDDKAAEYIKDLRKQNRYHEDVY